MYTISSNGININNYSKEIIELLYSR